MGVDIDSRDKLGRTPLLVSMSEGFSYSLLAHGAFIDARDIFDRTVLMRLAVRVGKSMDIAWAIRCYMRLTDAILDSFPDTTLTDCNGFTAMDLSTHPGFKERVEMYHYSNKMNFRRRKTILVMRSRVFRGDHVVDLNIVMQDEVVGSVVKRLVSVQDEGIFREIMKFV